MFPPPGLPAAGTTALEVVQAHEQTMDQKVFEEIAEDMFMEGHEQVAARRATGQPMVLPSWAEILAATDESLLLRILHSTVWPLIPQHLTNMGSSATHA